MTHRLEAKDEERGSRDRWMHGCGEIRRDARKDEGEARSRVKSGLETSFPRREILSLTISKSNGIIINSGREQTERERKRVRIGLSVFFFFFTKKRDDTVTAACLITRGEVAFVSCGSLSLSRERQGKREKHIGGSEKDWKKGKRGGKERKREVRCWLSLRRGAYGTWNP